MMEPFDLDGGGLGINSILQKSVDVVNPVSLVTHRCIVRHALRHHDPMHFIMPDGLRHEVDELTLRDDHPAPEANTASTPVLP